jgi:hypothetical protein
MSWSGVVFHGTETIRVHERSVTALTEPNQPRSEASRQRRSAHRQLAERRQQRSRMVWIGAAVVAIVVVAIAAYLILNRKETPPPVLGAVQTYSDLSRNHTTAPVSYPQNPPVGGDHDPVWQNCGYYDKPVRNENAVHSLEHGAVWITYRPDLPQAQIDTLKALAESQTFILVSPKDDLPAPVVASAWGKQLLLDSADDPGLDEFIRSYRLDPKGPELGAPCTGGTSATV